MWRLSTAVSVVAVLLAVVPSAHAAFPGENGKIAFYRIRAPSAISPYDVWKMNAGGGGELNLTSGSTTDSFDPAWSPDGSRIAFTRSVGSSWDVFVMNADGSVAVNLTNSPGVYDRQPTWSPDGTKIAFKRDGVGLLVMNFDGSGQVLLTATQAFSPNWSPDGTKIAFDTSDQIKLINADGSGETQVTLGPETNRKPTWSPDGAQIAFTSLRDGNGEIYAMNADGSDQTRLTNNPAADHSPAWSPDGTKIAFSSTRTGAVQTFTMNADGSGATQLTTNSSVRPDWQPVQPGYPRPKAATEFSASLVPAYIVCSSPNRTHGPPLGFSSCSPPQERSGVLTVGTPDANGLAVQMAGSLKLAVLAGNPATPADDADLSIDVSITDVRCRATNAACPGGPLSDYAGRLLAVPNALRITDRLNTPPGPVGGPGTGDTQLELPFDCVPTADSAVGSTCTLATTVDALIPNAIPEGQRAVWELGQIHVRDAGPNGTGFESPACPPACGDGDETLFLRQGVFVP